MNRKISLLFAALMALSFTSLAVRAADKPAEPAKAEAAKPAPAAEKAAPAAESKAAGEAKDQKKKAKQKKHVHTRDHKQL